MTDRPALRGVPGDHPASPTRLVHLGLGHFFRSHQAWYTHHASDTEQWQFTAFAGHPGNLLVEQLNDQDSRYTLIVRGDDADRTEVVASISQCCGADERDAWEACWGAPDLAVITTTVTEHGYPVASGGGLDFDRPDIQSDLATLRRGPHGALSTVPARIVAGLAARRRSGGGPVALVPCDNLAANGVVARRLVLDMAGALDPGLATWIDGSLATVTTVVDRITPSTTDRDRRRVLELTGRTDRCPVVTEPFAEWVLSGAFPAGRPRWEEAGATFTDDIAPYEHRKLWLLNGAHSLLAYAGSARGHTTVAGAIADGAVLAWVEEWWSDASPHIGHAPDVLLAYRSLLLERFSNRRIEHRLDQIAIDGSAKIPVRVLPVLQAERKAGRLPTGATRVIAAWIHCLRDRRPAGIARQSPGLTSLVNGPLPVAARRVLTTLDPALADDVPVVEAIVDQCRQFSQDAAP